MPRSPRTVVAAVVGLLALMMALPPTSSATARGTSTGTTILHFQLKGCSNCSIRLARGISGEYNVYRSSWRKADSNGRIRIAGVGKARTQGMSFELRDPRQTGGDWVPNIVIRYGGTSPGAQVGSTSAKSRKTGSGCWAGTQRSSVNMYVSVVTISAPQPNGSPGRLPVAWLSPQGYSSGGMVDTYHGGIGNQDAFFC